MRASQNPASQPLPLLFKLQKERKKKEEPKSKPKAFQKNLINVFWASALWFKASSTAIKIRNLDHPLQKKAIVAGLQCNNREQYFVWCYLLWSGGLTIGKGATPRLSLSQCAPLFSSLILQKTWKQEHSQEVKCWAIEAIKILWLLRKPSPGHVPQAKEKNEDPKTLQCRNMLDGCNWVGRGLPGRVGCLFFRYQRHVTMAAQLRVL